MFSQHVRSHGAVNWRDQERLDVTEESVVNWCGQEVSSRSPPFWNSGIMFTYPTRTGVIYIVMIISACSMALDLFFCTPQYMLDYKVVIHMPTYILPP